MIVGTSITCSATTGSEAKNLTTSAAWPTICGTGASRTGTRTGSTFCSTVRRRTRSCGLTSVSRSGRDLATGTSSTSMAKYWVPAAWGVGVFRIVAVQFNSLPHSPALAVLCPLEEWCANVARAWAIDCCSCRQAARSRRPLRR